MRRIAPVLLLILLSSCELLGVDEPFGPTTLDQLSDGTWWFSADRTWQGTAQFPDDELSEADYVAFNGPTYTVVLSDAVGRIAVTGGGLNLVGTRSDFGSLNEVRFDLTGGTVAGGRFVIGSDGTQLAAELTLYGAGEPITLSERGRLLQ